MKLNLGCGRLKMAGYVNVDIRPDVGAEVVGDAVEYVRSLEDGSVTNVHAVHFLEHLPWPTAQELVRLLFAKMRSGAWVALETPDLLKCLRQLERAPASPGPVANIFGHYASHGEVEHRWGYTEGLLTSVLRAAGFVDIREDAKSNYAHPRLGLARDIRVIGRKP